MTAINQKMAEIEQPPQNGREFAIENDENKVRPADIEQDMREMERRKRVEAIMGSKLFREELERIVDTARDGGSAGILQQLSDIVGLPLSRVGNVFKANNHMLPINDIRGVESMGYTKGEKILRCKLAATFRMLDLYGWTQGIGAQITARLKVDQEVFLVNPYGMLYHEITASSLNKIDMQGHLIEQGTTNFGVNKNHFVLHSTVHAARPDIRCVIYIGCSAVVAISSLKVGLLPLTHDACVLGEIGSHPYNGSMLEIEERENLVRNVGPISKVIMLCNYGALCCGETIEEAFFYACHIVQACETQLKLLPIGIENLLLIPEESRKAIYEQARQPSESLEKKCTDILGIENSEITADSEDIINGTTLKISLRSTPKFRIGGVEFEAIMRMLDNAGYRTGYSYRHPLIKSELPKHKNDVELPPAVSSLGYLLEEEELYKQGIWKKGDLRKGGDRSRWLNSPNVYQKVEVLETGTPDPKKITKWVSEGSPTHGTPVRIEDPLQFVPTGTNKDEFKRVQQQIKDNRRADKISAGPQSHILEGVTWDEANRVRDASVSSVGDHVVLMGAASKGIIQRGFQHNATVYKAPYTKNPFDNVTDDDLNEYKMTVERKKKSIHGEYTDTDFSESEVQSSMFASAGAELIQNPAVFACHSGEVASGEDLEHQIMRIETTQAPIPSQPEVVMSDDTEELTNDNCQKYQDLFIDVTAHNENIYAGDQNEGNNKDLTADLKSHTLYRRQKQNLVPPITLNSGSFLQKLVQSDFTTKDSNNNFSTYNHNSQDIDVNSITKSYYNKNDNSHIIISPHYNKVLSYLAPVKPNNIYYEIRYANNEQSTTTFDFRNCTDSSLVSETSDADKLYSKSLFCHAPKVCESIFQSLHRPLENKLILNIPFTMPLPAAYAMFTPHKNESISTRSQKRTYRTVSHFGFNSPLSTPKIEHLHIPHQRITKYVPLTKSTSYEEIFSSSRYIDLCENCFEKIVRLKPELVSLKTRMRNMLEYYDSNRNALECNSVETTETQTTFPSTLEPVIEESIDFISEESSAANYTFMEKIARMNYSEESVDVNNVAIPCDISMHNSKQKSGDKVIDLKTDIIQNLHNHESKFIGNELSRSASITEIWEFGNWQNQLQSLSDINVETSDVDGDGATDNSLECSALLQSKRRRFMSREERNERKHEFQELWEEHITFFNNKEDVHDTEPIFDENSGKQFLAQVDQIEHRPPETFHGHSKVFKRIFSDLHETKPYCENETTNTVITKSVNDNYSIQKLNIYNYRENMFFHNVVDAMRKTKRVKINIAKEYLRSIEEFILYEQNQEKLQSVDSGFNIITNQEVGLNKIVHADLLETAAPQMSGKENDLNYLDRIILHKIEINQLKESSPIFEKIDSTIRNKYSRSKLDFLLQKHDKKSNDEWKIPEDMISSASTTPKIVTKIDGFENSCSSSFNLGQQQSIVSKDCTTTVETISATSHIDCENNASMSISIPINKFKTHKNIGKYYQRENLQHRSLSQFCRKNLTSSLQTLSPALAAAMHTCHSTPELSHKSPKVKSIKRNFVQENIRSASIPRIVKHRHYNTSPLSKLNPLSTAASAGMGQKSSTPILTDLTDENASVYTFQTKLVRGSPKLWISLSHTPTKKLQMKNNLHNHQRIHSKLPRSFFSNLHTCSEDPDSDFRSKGIISDLKSQPLCEHVETIEPRVDDYDENVQVSK